MLTVLRKISSAERALAARDSKERFPDGDPEKERGIRMEIWYCRRERRSGASGGVTHRSQGGRRASQALSLQFRAFRRSAPSAFLGTMRQSSGAGASRERDQFSAPAKRGRGTTGAREASEPWWRGRRALRYVVVAGH